MNAKVPRFTCQIFATLGHKHAREKMLYVHYFSIPKWRAQMSKQPYYKDEQLKNVHLALGYQISEGNLFTNYQHMSTNKKY